jgi:hypothetical protein
MIKRSLPSILGLAVVLVGVWSCDGRTSPTEVATTDGSVSAAAQGDHAPQLNLSHIECVDGAVEVHFVLLFAADADPGDLTYINNGQIYTIPRGPSTGNVWHYTHSGLPDGDYDVTSASVTLADGTVVTLHNPGDYSGTYDCASCPLPDPEPLVCLAPRDLGSPAAECGYFGLVPLGKDDDLSGSTWIASMGADLSIVKDGRGPCPKGTVAYRTYTDVQSGDLLEQPAGAGDISHVTYCGCAE